MDDELRYLVHFFNDPQYLFKTITMAGISRMDGICDRISSQKGWFWGRFAPSERGDYLQRRLFVEKELYEGYTREYGSLKERIPIYFYIYPGITQRKLVELGKGRTTHDEMQPKIVLLKIRDIQDTKNLTFTLNDSLNAYWKKTMEAGIKCRGDADIHVVLPDHNKVFPFSMLETMHRKYRHRCINYEIQVWDHQLLEKARYSILGREDA